jgi:predicted NBD/HSP70 family sugar kinase
MSDSNRVHEEASDSGLRVGIDLGGTKIEGVVVRLPPPAADWNRERRGESGAHAEPVQVLARLRRPTERTLGYEHIIEAVAEVIFAVTREAGLRTPPPIGVGMPGSVNKHGVVKNSNTTCLNGRPFRQDLIAAVGSPIAFSNDANCFTLAEARFGAGRGHRVVFGVIMGTGVGGGLVFSCGPGQPGRTWDGPHGIAGEWGHVALDPVGGPPCYCGRRGCIETYLCGPAIEADYRRRSGTSLPLAELAARSDDPVAAAVLDAALDTFGRALGTVINILDPEVVVLGGGVSKLDLWYSRGPERVARWIFGGEFATPIVRHEIGDSAGVLGAALLPEPFPQ